MIFFGGVDQRKIMAEAPPKPQRQRRNRRQRLMNNEIVEINIDTPKNGSNVAPQQQQRSRRRWRRRRRQRPVFGPWLPGQGPRGRLHRAIKREIKREGLDGPRVSVQQRVSSTFGLVGPNKSGNVELELNFFLHPSLAKEANDGTSFGPVQALAAQYALWKLKYLRLRFTPMVGASAVSGTVVRASLNLSQSPGGTNWSGLGTRLHVDMHPGQATVFHLRGDQIGGPRDGGWWLTDTNEEGSQSAGPIIEVHTLGETMSTFRAEKWNSPLFIVEGVGIWQFANYQVKPALGMLERKQADVDVTMNAVAGQPITMELPLGNVVTQFMVDAEPLQPDPASIPAVPRIGETVFQIVDVGADIAAKFAPPPFSWLISGGWWFLKRVFGKSTRAGTATFNVYASLADAQNERPAIAGSTTSTTTQSIPAELIVTQINAPNVGPQSTAVAHTRAAVPVPLESGLFRLHSEVFPLESIAWEGRGSVAYPTCYIVGNAFPISESATPVKYYIKTAWYVTQTERGDTTTAFPPSVRGAFLHTVYKLVNPRFTDLTGNIEYIPPSSASGASLFHGQKGTSSTSTYHRIGEVVATAAIDAGNSAFLGVVLTLIRVTKAEGDTYEENNQKFFKTDQGGSVSTQRSMVKLKQVNENTTNSIRKLGFQVGDYLLGVAFAGNTDTSSVDFPIGKLTKTNVDIAITLPFNKITTSGADSYTTDNFFRLDRLQDTQFTPNGVPYNLTGQLFPAYSLDLNLNMVQPVDHELLDQLIALGFKPAVDELPPQEFLSETSDEEEPTLQELLKMLIDLGRLPTAAEIAYRNGEFESAYEIYKAENESDSD